MTRNEKLPSVWLVYYFRGEIKVQHGKTDFANFYPDENIHTWKTKMPKKYMEIFQNKVLTHNTNDIPTAKKMIYDYNLSRVNDIRDVSIRSLANIQRMIKEGL